MHNFEQFTNEYQDNLPTNTTKNNLQKSTKVYSYSLKPAIHSLHIVK